MKMVKILVFVSILIFYGSLLLFQIELPAGDDMPRHIKNGELIVAGDFDILYTNVYSYTEPDHQFVNHHWLSGVVFYLLHQVIGWNGLVVFKVIVLLSAFTLLFLTALKKANFWLVAFFSVPTILILIERSTLRPEIFSYLFIAIFLYILIDSEKYPERNRIFWLVPLQLLWVNMHVFWSIGIMLVGGFLFEKIILNYKDLKNNLFIKKLALLFIALTSVSFINPNGISGVLYHYPQNFPLKISENLSLLHFQYTLAPWNNISVALFGPLVFLLAASFILSFRQKRIFYFMGSIATAVLGFLILRGVALFGLLFLPAISANLNGIFNEAKEFLSAKTWRIRSGVKNFLIIAFIIALSYSYFIFLGSHEKFLLYEKPTIGLARLSNDAAQFFKEKRLQGPIFNNADIGSYLIYHLYPHEKVFVDNRFGDAYSASFFDATYLPMLRDENVWRAKLAQYDFNVIFFYYYDQSPNIRTFLHNRMRDSAWALVYADTYNMIFLRNTSMNKDVIQRFHVTPKNAGEKLEYLTQSKYFDDQVAAADIFYLMDLEDLGEEVFKKVVAEWPHKGKIWMVMGEFELNKNDMGSAPLSVTYLERAIAEGQKTAEAYTFLGLAYARTGELLKAEEVLKRALKINPRRADTKMLLQAVQQYDNNE